MTELEVGQNFETERGHYTTLNGTRQRVKIKYPERTFQIIQSGELNKGKVTVTRTS